LVALVAFAFLTDFTAADDGRRPGSAPVRVTFAGRPIPPEVEYRPDLVYSKPDAQTALALDIAMPRAGKGPFPAVLCIHGGGMMMGSRKNYALILELARHGYVAASVSYRFAPRYQFPAQIHDVKCAVRWLRCHAAEFKIDPQRIAALGNSSGAQLACLLATTSEKDGLEGSGGCPGYSTRVQAVVSYYGLTDLPRLHQACLQRELPSTQGLMVQYSLVCLLGGPPEKVSDRYSRASPITYVSQDTAPTLLIHGTADQLIPFEQSQRLAKKMIDAGVEVEFLPVKGAPHAFGGKDEEAADGAAIRFLNKHLNPTVVNKEVEKPRNDVPAMLRRGQMPAELVPLRINLGFLP
jgi:acetyl esterase/lipase